MTGQGHDHHTLSRLFSFKEFREGKADPRKFSKKQEARRKKKEEREKDKEKRIKRKIRRSETQARARN